MVMNSIYDFVSSFVRENLNQVMYLHVRYPQQRRQPWGQEAKDWRRE